MCLFKTIWNDGVILCVLFGGRCTKSINTVNDVFVFMKNLFVLPFFFFFPFLRMLIAFELDVNFGYLNNFTFMFHVNLNWFGRELVNYYLNWIVGIYNCCVILLVQLFSDKTYIHFKSLIVQTFQGDVKVHTKPYQSHYYRTLDFISKMFVLILCKYFIVCVIWIIARKETIKFAERKKKCLLSR